MYHSTVVFLLSVIVIFHQQNAVLASNVDALKLGSFCNPIDGCTDSSLTCLKNQCECASGYAKDANETCTAITCQVNSQCNKVDPGRQCDRISGRCSHCKDGLILDSIANRCVSKLGYGCSKTTDCWSFSVKVFNGTISEDEEGEETVKTLPICRSGRCVCRVNYYPTDDWSACQRRRCTSDSSSDEQCNPFGDDPHRFCARKSRSCVCLLGYYEDLKRSVCLPYVPIQYSLMMPFWLTMIMFTICILVYISRRLTRGRGMFANESAANSEAMVIPNALNRPPPSYDTVVKETSTGLSPGNVAQPRA